MISVEEAVRLLARDPANESLLFDSYLSGSIREDGNRFLSSAEFEEVQALFSHRMCGSTILDLGAGNGIASYAFARRGAKQVYALEPDPSDYVGRGAIRDLCSGLAVEVLGGVGEAIPLPRASVDIAYARQVLHHCRDLLAVMQECARVLRPGGLLLACREHVADDERQLNTFLAGHPMHRLTGTENAFPLTRYTGAIQSAGLEILKIFGPWDSVINAFPTIRSRPELEMYPSIILKQKIGCWAEFLLALPVTDSLVRWRLMRPRPGRMYSFLARTVGGSE